MSNPNDTEKDKDDVDVSVDANETEVEIFHRLNKLKLKIGVAADSGSGYIDKNSINKAQNVIKGREYLFKDELGRILDDLIVAWKKLKDDHDEGTFEKGLEELYHGANHAKDLASTYDYGLIQYFALSLREFAEGLTGKKKEHLIIIQAHIDVMNIVYQNDIKGEGSEKAQELKRIVETAIKKYS